jgi:diguanylate cyclase (GGDEF)-like protein
MARILEDPTRVAAQSATPRRDAGTALIAAALAARGPVRHADESSAATRLVAAALATTFATRVWVMAHHAAAADFEEVACGPEAAAALDAERRKHVFLSIEEASSLRAACARAGRRIRPGRRGTRLLDLFAARELVVFAPSSVTEPPELMLVVDPVRKLALHERLALQLTVDGVAFPYVVGQFAQRIELYREDAERDFLTGIYNRRLVMRLLDQEIRKSRRTRAPLSVLMLDVDNFKAFNDAYGHLAGDEVLRELARMVSQCARGSDVVGRFGGEEFLVVLPDTPVENAAILAERLRQEVENFGHERLRQFNDQLPTISIGVCAAGPRDDTESAIARCDRALYESKHRGRNCFSLGLSDEEMP